MKTTLRLVFTILVCAALSLSVTYTGVPDALASGPSGSVYCWGKLPLYGGNINSIAIDPITPTTLYLGMDDDGIYRSTDGGAVWEQMATTLEISSTRSIVIDPLVPATLYAGTVGGVFRSTDRGERWESMSAGLTNTTIWHLAVNPVNPSTVYASTNGGVFRSADRGEHWQPSSVGLNSRAVACVAVDPFTPTILYAGTFYGGIFRSIDGGDHWQEANSGLVYDGTIFASIVIDPVDTATLFAASDDGLFRSVDSGSVWQQMSTGLTNPHVRSLGISPSAPTTIYAGTIGGLFRSTDRGEQWEQVNGVPATSQIGCLALDPATPLNLYVCPWGRGVLRSLDGGEEWQPVVNGLTAKRVKSLAIDPLNPSTLYVGTWEDGVYGSTDYGGSWRQLPIDLVRQSQWSVAVDPLTPATLYAAAAGGGILRSVDSGDHWVQVNTGLLDLDVTCVAVDPLTPTTLYVGTLGGGVYRSLDSGSHWQQANAGRTESGVRAILIDPLTPTTVYSTNYNDVFRSFDRGDHWEAMNAGYSSGGTQCLAIDRLSSTTLFVGGGFGVLRTTNGGASWVEVNTGLTTGRITSLAVDPISPGTVYAGTDAGVFRSVDNGMSWSAINTGLTHRFINCLAIDPVAPATIFAGTYGGGAFRYEPAWSLATDVSPSHGGSIARRPDQPVFVPGSIGKLTALPTEGWHFISWSGDLTGTTNPATITMDADKTVTANFAIDTHTLSTGQIGSGSVSKNPSQATYDYGAVVQLTATPDPGWHFTDWSGDLAGSANPASITMDDNKTVIASFAVNTGTITISSGGNGTVIPVAPVSQAYGATGSTITATPITGYHFVSWSATLNPTYVSIADAALASTTLTTTSSMPDGGTALITANFAINTYNLTTNVVGSGSVARSPDLGLYDHGASVQLTAAPILGWHFVKWSGDLTGAMNPATITMDADKTVTATFAINTYALTVDTVGSGSVAKSPDQASYDHGSVVTLTAAPATGWHLVNWSGATPDGADPLQATVTMDADKTVTGAFAINTYAVTVTVGPNGKVVPGTGPVPHHATRVFNVNPDAGYVIDRVILDGVIQTDAAGRRSYVVTLRQVEGEHTLSATFRPVPDVRPPTITLPDLSKTPGIVGWSGGAVPTFTVGASPFHLTFTLEDDGGTVKWTITVNGTVIVDPVDTGSITYPIPLTQGRNDVEVSASDTAGNFTSQKLVIYLDSVGPVLALDRALPASVTRPQLTIAGSAVDAVSGLKSLTINGTRVVPFLDGSFRETLLLSKGLNSIVIEAEDRAGHRVSATHSVTYAVTLPPALTATTVAFSIGTAEMDVNGVPFTLDAAPVIQNSRTLLPIRAIVEAFGGSIEWYADLRVVTMYLNGRQVSLQIGDPRGFVDGVQKPLDAADPKVVPIIISGRTFLPLRFVAENLGLQVTWDAAMRTVTVTN